MRGDTIDMDTIQTIRMPEISQARRSSKYDVPITQALQLNTAEGLWLMIMPDRFAKANNDTKKSTNRIIAHRRNLLYLDLDDLFSRLFP